MVCSLASLAFKNVLERMKKKTATLTLSQSFICLYKCLEWFSLKPDNILFPHTIICTFILINLFCCSVPLQQSDEDVSQFDTRFTRQTPVDSPDDTSLSHSAELAFAVRSLSFFERGEGYIFALETTVYSMNPQVQFYYLVKA